MGNAQAPATVRLPAPRTDGKALLEQTIAMRRSVRRFAKRALNLRAVSQLLWAAQGITASGGFRAAPSAGALFPLELYWVAGKVTGLATGVYHYIPKGHHLKLVLAGDQRPDLTRASLAQRFVGQAPGTIVICAIHRRVTNRYGRRGVRYVHMEVGHAAQNIHLQAVALGLVSVPVGAFRDEEVRKVVGASGNEEPLYVIPVGVAG